MFEDDNIEILFFFKKFFCHFLKLPETVFDFGHGLQEDMWNFNLSAEFSKCRYRFWNTDQETTSHAQLQKFPRMSFNLAFF